MIDRTARNAAAVVLRHFASGQITNLDFENRFPSSEDPVTWAIENTVWCFYDDFETHKMTGCWTIDKEWKSIIARWVIFLHSDEEYTWPVITYPGIRPLQFSFFGSRERRFLSHGYHEFWPFRDRESYERAKARPVFLSGT